MSEKCASRYDFFAANHGKEIIDGKVSKYAYDALNRVTSITGQSGTIAYSYDKTGLNTQITYSNGTGTGSNMRYDAVLRMQQVTRQRQCHP